MYLYLTYKRHDLPFTINNIPPKLRTYHYIVRAREDYKPWNRDIKGYLLYTDDEKYSCSLMVRKIESTPPVIDITLPNSFIDRIEYETYERLATYHFENLV